MYSFEPSEEQQMLIEVVRRYATNDLRPAAHEADEADCLSEPLIEKGWELGILQAAIPPEYGGFGDYSALTGVLAVEELAFGDLAGALAVLAPALYALPILLVGSEEQKKTYLPEIAESAWAPFTAAFLEQQFDLDHTSLQATATLDGDAYVLNGRKSYVPFADRARSMIVYAGLDGKTQGFIVPGDAEGLSVGSRQQLLGIQAVPVFEVNLEGVRIPVEARLGGPEGHALGPIMASSRVANAALAVGVSRAAYEYSREYAKEREVFGVKVAQKQAIAFMLAEMATDIEAIRLLTWEAAWMIDQGEEGAGRRAYLADLGAADVAMMVTDRAVQILGGYGYIREYPVELWMRNGRGFSTLTGLAMV